jgi:hypothetical protein
MIDLVLLMQRPTPTPYPTPAGTPVIDLSNMAGLDISTNMVQGWNMLNQNGLLTFTQTAFVILLIMWGFAIIITALKSMDNNAKD